MNIAEEKVKLYNYIIDKIQNRVWRDFPMYINLSFDIDLCCSTCVCFLHVSSASPNQPGKKVKYLHCLL